MGALCPLFFSFMLNIITIYLIIGIIFSFMMDLLHRSIQLEEFTNRERFYVVAAWPFFLLFFIGAIIHNLFRDR